MVQHTNVHELTAFDNAVGDLFVSSAWFCTARRVIMREYHAGPILLLRAQFHADEPLHGLACPRKRWLCLSTRFRLSRKITIKIRAQYRLTDFAETRASSQESVSGPPPAYEHKRRASSAIPLSWAYFATPIPSTCANSASSAVIKP